MSQLQADSHPFAGKAGFSMTESHKKIRRPNPAMGDPGFLRKRTDSLLRENIASSDAAAATEKLTKKDKKTFDFLIDAWAFSGEDDAADKALALLHKMEEIYACEESETAHLIRPDVRSYTKAINAIARTALPLAGEVANQVLAKMEELARTGENLDVKPNTHTYTAVVEAHANSAVPGSAQSAEDICELMVFKFENNDPDVFPTARCFNAAISAYAKSGEPGAAQRAQHLFNRMVDLYSLYGYEDIKPNRYNYNSLISAWANSNEEGSALRAEQVLLQMELGNECKPTTVTYNAVIDAYAKSGEEGSAEKAEMVLRHMEDRYQSGVNLEAKPNVRSYNSVINAWAKSGEDEAAFKAEETLAIMQNLAVQDPTIRPDVHSYCTVINAWARSQRPRKAERAWNIYRELKNSYESGSNQSLRPNVVALNAVLNACAYSSGDVHEQNKAMEIAHAVLKELEKSPYGSPDQVTYGTFLQVCANQMPECNTREQIVEVLFKKCCRDGQVGSLVLQNLKDAASAELYAHLVGTPIEHELELDELPEEWRCNVVEGKWRRRKNLN